MNGHESTASLLLAHGANVLAKNKVPYSFTYVDYRLTICIHLSKIHVVYILHSHFLPLCTSFYMSTYIHL